MVKSLRLTWLKRIFSKNDVVWKSYIRQILELSGVFFFFHSNYDVKDIPICSQFYTKFLQRWSKFHFEFDGEKKGQNIIWNNEGIRINKSPYFTKTLSNPAIFT